MTLDEIYSIAGAIILSLGGGAALVLACSTWLGKIWANRILAADRQKYEKEMEALRSKFSLTLKEYEIKTTAIQDERKAIVLKLSPLLSKVYYRASMYCDWARTPSDSLRKRLTDDSYQSYDAADKEVVNVFLESKLFLSKSLHSRISAFITELFRATTDIQVNLSYTSGENREKAKEEISSIGKKVKALQDELENILEEFRKILGTHA